MFETLFDRVSCFSFVCFREYFPLLATTDITMASKRKMFIFISHFVANVVAIQAAIGDAVVWTNKTVTLVSVHVGNNPLYGYYVSEPVYEVAVQEIKAQYPDALGDMTHWPIYLKSIVPGEYDLCEPGGDMVAYFFTDFYYNHTEIFQSNSSYPVLFSPGTVWLTFPTTSSASFKASKLSFQPKTLINQLLM